MKTLMLKSNEENSTVALKQSKRESPSIKTRAIRYLARREYSRQELRQKLRPYLQESENETTLKALLDELEQRGYLSDERFARSRVRLRSARYGNARLAYELKADGVSAGIIEKTLQDLGQSEYERARALWQKRFGVAPQDFKERGKQMRYLLARGFSMDVARRVIQSDDFEDYFMEAE